MTRSAHLSLIEAAAAFGYPLNDTGLCQGVTVKWLEACLLNKDEESRFADRVNKINSSADYTALVRDVNNVRMKVRKHDKLNSDELALLEIPAFFEGIQLYFSPEKYPSIWAHGLIQQQQNIDEVSVFAASTAINSLTKIYSEPGIYSLDKFTTYLDELKCVFNSNQQNVAILVCNFNHAIGLSYNVTSRSWTVMDINYWPPFESTNSSIIAGKILNGFRNSVSAVNISIIVSTNQPANASLLMQLNVLKNEHLALITTEKVAQQDMGILLYIAACHGQLDFVNMLIRVLVDNDKSDALNLTAANGATPLYAAAQSGHLEVVNALIKALVDNGKSDALNLALFKDYTPLHIAAEKGYLEIVNALIKALVDNGKSDALNQTETDGATPLYMAAQSGHLEVVNALIKALVDNGKSDALSSATDKEITPLLIAARFGHFETVNALVKALIDNDNIDDLYLSSKKCVGLLLCAALHGFFGVIANQLVNMMIKRHVSDPWKTIAGYKTAMFKIKPQNLTEEQMTKIDDLVQTLTDTMNTTFSKTGRSVIKEHIDALEQFKKLTLTMDASYAFKEIKNNKDFSHVNKATKSRTFQLMEEIENECLTNSFDMV